jgi:hypothetical protein
MNLLRSTILSILMIAFLIGCESSTSASSDSSSSSIVYCTIKDARDNQTYRIVTIGSQTWMAENLKYLPSVVGPGTGSKTTPHYYVYGYNGTNVTYAKATANYNTYGVLYNWPAAMNGTASSTTNPSGVQGVCPDGWHLPSDAEWTELTDYPGFTALLGGLRDLSGAFNVIGHYGFWWSATEDSASGAWGRGVDYHYSDVGRFDGYKEVGFSVRCVRD